MKRYVNYTSANGNRYEICGEVKIANRYVEVCLRDMNVIDIFQFVGDNSEVMFMQSLGNMVVLPMENVTYMSNGYAESKDTIRKVEEEKPQGMDRDAILNGIKMLAQSQGCYGRMYDALTSGSEDAENYIGVLVAQRFVNVVDMVMFIEG